MGANNFPFFGPYRLLKPLHLLQRSMLILKDYVSFCCTAVMQKCNILDGSVFLSCSMHSCVKISTRSLLLKRMFACSVRAVFENSYIRGECLMITRPLEDPKSLNSTVVPLFT